MYDDLGSPHACRLYPRPHLGFNDGDEEVFPVVPWRATQEWRALQLVHALEPDLVPRPLDCDLGDAAPYVTMSRVPGEPLGPDVAITPRCLDAAVEAITTLHEAISPETLADLPERWWGPAVGIAEIRAWAEREGARGDLAGRDPSVQEALAAGRRWVAAVPVSLTQTERPVFARAVELTAIS